MRGIGDQTIKLSKIFLCTIFFINHNYVIFKTKNDSNGKETIHYNDKFMLLISFILWPNLFTLLWAKICNLKNSIDNKMPVIWWKNNGLPGGFSGYSMNTYLDEMCVEETKMIMFKIILCLKLEYIGDENKIILRLGICGCDFLNSFKCYGFIFFSKNYFIWSIGTTKNLFKE